MTTYILPAVMRLASQNVESSVTPLPGFLKNRNFHALSSAGLPYVDRPKNEKSELPLAGP